MKIEGQDGDVMVVAFDVGDRVVHVPPGAEGVGEVEAVLPESLYRVRWTRSSESTTHEINDLAPMPLADAESVVRYRNFIADIAAIGCRCLSTKTCPEIYLDDTGHWCPSCRACVVLEGPP